ncbi:MAG: walR [Firmicutes bacterium]|nr:walR [Bacillota bacterium]
MKKYRMLVIDDEAKILRFIAANLKSLGYEVHPFATGTEALAQFDVINPDLVLLDITMPGLDGFQVLERIRSFSEVPVIMLTARDNANDKVLGLNSGADDYLTKPFSLEELFARVKAVLRRYDKTPLNSSTTSQIQNGPIRLNLAQRRLWVNQEELKLTETEYKLFSLLMLNMNKVVSHEQLLCTVWGAEYRDEVEYLRVTLARIRQKLKVVGQDSSFWVNYPGVGYMIATIQD